MTTQNDMQRFNKNPFLGEMLIPIKGKQVKLSKLGHDDNVLINQDTGEVLGTHVTTYKRVDSEKFVKLFTQNIAMTFELKSAGIKAFTVLIWAVEKAISKDLLLLDSYVLEDFLEQNQLKLSYTTFSRGLAELIKAKIIARNTRLGWYYINPNFVFNGDRIAFTQVIERAKPKDDTKTIDMFSE